jgi:hypothetical protein
MGYPRIARWMVHHGKSQTQMDDLYRGSPILGNPHIYLQYEYHRLINISM